MRLILVFLLALSFPAIGQVYKWTDAQGNVHFGTQPPPGHQEEVKIRESSAASTEPAPESDIIRQARELDERNLREAKKRMDKARDKYAEALAGIDDAEDQRPNYVCTGIENRIKLLYEDMEELKRQGYTIREKSRLDRKIKREEMHRDNLCR